MSIKSEFKYPGEISLSIYDGKGYPGCKAKSFLTTWGFNRFFKESPGETGHGLMVVHAEPVSRFLGLTVGWEVIYTTQLSPEEYQDMDEVTREIEFAMAERRKKRAAEREEAAKVDAAAQEEIKRRAIVGQKYEERVKRIRSLAPSDTQRKALDSALNAGDPDILFQTKLEAFQAGFVHGHQEGAKIKREE